MLTKFSALLIVLILTLVSSSSVFAFDTNVITQFKSGQYTLKSGSLEICGEGEFSTPNDGENILFGAKQGIFTHTIKNASMNDDADNEKQCHYNYSSIIKIKRSFDTITFNNVRRCSGKVIYTLKQKVEIRNDSISLEFKKTGKDSTQYACVWRRNI